MKTSEVLQRARALIADKRRWCQGVEAMDADSAPVSPWNPTAKTYCAIGALEKINELEQSWAYWLLNDLAGAEYGEDAVMVNDHGGGHPAVLRLYDLAISAAMSDEAGES